MVTLGGCDSLLQLAFGANAVLPLLISDFEALREKAAEVLVRKLKEFDPTFNLRERDRVEFVEFAFRSSPGLRRAHYVTRATVCLALGLCGLSLLGLGVAALKPEQQISDRLFFGFFGFALVIAPFVYYARNVYLKWLYSVFIKYGTNKQQEAEVFAFCVNAHLEHQKTWEPIEQRLREDAAALPILIWKLRLVTFKLTVLRWWLNLRSVFRRPK